MRSHFMRGKPSASNAQVARNFESLMPAAYNVYVRVMRLSELPAEAEVGIRYYGVFDMDGSPIAYGSSRLTVVETLRLNEYLVHTVH